MCVDIVKYIYWDERMNKSINQSVATSTGPAYYDYVGMQVVKKQ